MKTLQSVLRVLTPLALLASIGCGGGQEGGAGPAPAASGNSSPASTSGGKSLRIGMMPKLTGIDYFNKAKLGAEEAAKELGVELTYDGPPQDKVELQTQMIDEWTALGMDVIAVAPNDPFVIAPSLARAGAKNITTLTWDADASATGSKRSFFVNQSPTSAIGETLVDIMAKGIGGEGKTIIVTGSATSPNQNAWMKEMKQVLAKKYPKIQLLETLVPDENQNRARQMTMEVLNAEPELKGIWGITSVALPGVAEGVKQAGKSGKVYVTGLSLPSTVKPYVKDGTIQKFVLWNPIDLGYLTVHVAKGVAEKKVKEGVMDFGRLKGIKIVKDEVILGPPLIFDKDNIDKFDF